MLGPLNGLGDIEAGSLIGDYDSDLLTLTVHFHALTCSTCMTKRIVQRFLNETIERNFDRQCCLSREVA